MLNVMEAIAETQPEKPAVALPRVPVLACAAGHQAVWMSTDGEIIRLNPEKAGKMALAEPVLTCHAPYTASRIGLDFIPAYDVLELFAFVHPATFCVPTVNGLAQTLGLEQQYDLEDQPMLLIECAHTLLKNLQSEDNPRSNPAAIARAMLRNGDGWIWSPFILRSLGEPLDPPERFNIRGAMSVWRDLPEWSEHAPEPPAGHERVSEKDIAERLHELLSARDSEDRPEQLAFSQSLSHAFSPIEEEEKPNIAISEAGTGIGKTLGYLAPATLWAEKNDGTVWVSTYTKNLQRQIDEEMVRLYPEPETRNRRVVTRKGRENYLCLLNFEDAVAGMATQIRRNHIIATGLVARWIETTKDGDMNSGDLPGWLSGLLGLGKTMGLTDRRGECIYSACDHYHRCFVERSVRKAKRADIVIANHALVMIQTALSGMDDVLPSRYVFDEAHHIFEAADSAFGAHLSGTETYDLRRWLLGVGRKTNSRMRGLKRRAEDLINDEDATSALQSIVFEAEILPNDGWRKRLQDNAPVGPVEEFLALVRKQVYARAEFRDGPYSIETPIHPPGEGILLTAQSLRYKLDKLRRPMQSLAKYFRERLSNEAETLDTDSKRRIESVLLSLERKTKLTLSAWQNMLETLETETPPQHVDWFGVDRIDGKDFDIGMFRHYVDPTQPFAAALKPHAHGIAFTSATLTDSNHIDSRWTHALERTGTRHFENTPLQQDSFPSPFDYGEQTRVFIITDVNKTDNQQVAAAYRSLFEASRGGALGIFTAIQRLRAVHKHIVEPLESQGIPILSQHIDGMDTGTLVDIFRSEKHSCLLGTDAVRDGVDVPGESLRLIVFDRVPWPRPSILHKARRDHFGGRDYDEMLTRLKLKQAYGRLIRRKDDHGVFIMLDNATPTRLLDAFPEGVEVQRIGLADAIAQIKDFLPG